MTLIDFKTMSNFANLVFVLTVDLDIRRAFTGPLVVWFKAFTIYRNGWPSGSCNPRAFNINVCSPFKGGSKRNLALISQAVSEEKMFEHCGRTTATTVYP